MANKFIVFVVLAAVLRASLAASAGSSNLQAAKEASQAEWQQVGDTLCKSIQNEWWPLDVAREEYRWHQVNAATIFRSVAPRSNNATVTIETTAFSAALRDAIFRGIRVARSFGDLATILAEIESYREQLPYDGFIERFHLVTEDTGSYTPAVDAIKQVYKTLFNEIEKLAVSVSEGGAAIDACAIDEIHAAVRVETEILFTWLSESE